MMSVVAVIAGLLVIWLILLDSFETIVLPRRVTRRKRLTNLFYQLSWRPWRAIARRLPNATRRENFLSFYGPLSLLLLLVVWAVGLIIGFGLIYWGLDLRLAIVQGDTHGDLFTYVYMSGVTFFTLGFGDVTAHDNFGRMITVGQAGVGFGFLALVIGYVPVTYSAFSQREIAVSLLDERAGSPPCAVEMLRRYATRNHAEKIDADLGQWESWAAQLLESHLSYPVLCYYRSQHENQSWVAALTAILDVCALVLVGVEGIPKWSAKLTFAMARHTAVDLAQAFRQAPMQCVYDRLPPADLVEIRAILASSGIPLREGPEVEARLRELRDLYEPYLVALSDYLVMDLPNWLPPAQPEDNWQRTAWQEADSPNLF